MEGGIGEELVIAVCLLTYVRDSSIASNFSTSLLSRIMVREWSFHLLATQKYSQQLNLSERDPTLEQVRFCSILYVHNPFRKSVFSARCIMIDSFHMKFTSYYFFIYLLQVFRVARHLENNKNHSTMTAPLRKVTCVMGMMMMGRSEMMMGISKDDGGEK